jgi:hypothetical protein
MSCIPRLSTRLRFSQAPNILALAFAIFAALSYPAKAATWASWLTLSSATPSGLDASTAALRVLPVSPVSPAIAVHATPEGHWQFTNRAGETFTAGTPTELKRASATMLPNATDGFASATLILSYETLFTGATVLKDLPQAKAYLTTNDGIVFPVQRAANTTLAIIIRPGVVLAADNPMSVSEALGQLRRPLDAGRLRILSATPGGPPTLTATPKFDAGQTGAAIDAIEPDHLAEALAIIAHQTAILTARLDGANLAVLPPSGGERTLSYATLTTAAANADVDLLILHADPPRQPGGRNWLWQAVQVSGLDHATKRATFADFLDQLATGHDPFLISLSAEGANRVRLTAQPVPAVITTARSVTDWLKQAAGTVTGQLTGAVQPGAIHASLVSMSRRNELFYRFIPRLPVTPLALYVAALVLGLAGVPIARNWWRKAWPLEARSDYPTAFGYGLARIVRGLVFVTLFLPLAALPAVVVRLWPRRETPSPRSAREEG